MDTYDSYKPSGVDWLGDIPSHWEVKPMRSHFALSTEKNTTEGGKLLSLSQYYGITEKDYDSISRLAESTIGYNVVRKGQFVMNIMLAWNGSYAVSDNDGIISPAYVVYDFISDCDKRYFNYLMRQKLYSDAFRTESRGIRESRLRLYPQSFKIFPLIVPPVEEQRAIAEYLDVETAKIDRAIEAQQKMIDALNERMQIIISRDVTRGLNPDIPLRDSGISWMGQIPAHWEVRRLKYAVQLKSDKTVDPIPYIALENIEGFSGKIVSVSEIQPDGECNRFIIGDVLFNKLRPYLAKCFVAEFEGKASSELLILRYFCGNPEYLKFVLLGSKLLSHINSSTYGAKMPRANWNFIGNCQIPIPPIKEQNRIVEFIKTKTNNLTQEITLCKKMIDLLTERKQIIISQVVTGKQKVL